MTSLLELLGADFQLFHSYELSCINAQLLILDSRFDELSLSLVENRNRCIQKLFLNSFFPAKNNFHQQIQFIGKKFTLKAFQFFFLSISVC